MLGGGVWTPLPPPPWQVLKIVKKILPVHSAIKKCRFPSPFGFCQESARNTKKGLGENWIFLMYRKILRSLEMAAKILEKSVQVFSHTILSCSAPPPRKGLLRTHPPSLSGSPTLIKTFEKNTVEEAPKAALQKKK